ncbi:hypothetical protein DES47_10247 [Roseateles toxinivorans]|uniref:Uncharacterized protein n=1 Tax=Roseateles toxinivorans TaxID=270368 RepID=A0A4R6QP87_9BURK|nr:hypothetical protein DES47_10247 [Roseateles toxinivorans]
MSGGILAIEELGSSIGCDQFNAVAKRIIRESPSDGRKRRVFGNLEPFILKTSKKFLELLDEKSGMRFHGRAKATLDPKMNLNAAALKPGTTAAGKFLWLRQLGEAQ